MPLASTQHMSLVEVSPSTLMRLKLVCTSAESAFCSICGEMAASVVTNTSMVAMLGWIMPEPLAMPPRCAVLPPRENSTAADLTFVSVVSMASAAGRPSVERPETSASMPAAMGEMSSLWPMTPVEATTTSLAGMPSASAARAHIFCATSSPSALQVLALPLLQRMAEA